MKTFGVIPIKRLLNSKERLSRVLDEEERKVFVLSMLEDVLTTTQSSTLHQTVVIGFDPIVQEIAEKFGVQFLPDRQKGLNNSLEYATNWCIKRAAEAVLVLPIDIPLISVADIDELIHISSEKTVVISPSKDDGTNALLRSPPNAIKTHFGIRSYKNHINAAIRKGIPIKIFWSPRVSLDIDSIQDLRRFYALGRGKLSYKFLEQIKFGSTINGVEI